MAREVAEETSLVVDVGELIGEVLRPGIGDVVYRIRDFAVSIISGSPVAGDDAADVAWVALDELAQWPLTEGLLDALTHWNVVTANTKRPQADKQVTDS